MTCYELECHRMERVVVASSEYDKELSGSRKCLEII
jgi:hypothetical protein